jgi:sigma-E factor negative regulatory protein RseA
MNQQMQEQLSALMDGELERDETRFLLKRLSDDRLSDGMQISARWARYHVARQALRRQDIAVLVPGFADAVMARLDLERQVAQSHPVSNWLRWGAGGAIAASVAVAALVVTRPAGESAPAAVPGVVRSVAQQGAPISVAPVAASTSYPGDFRPPLLAPNAPVDASPVSFGTDMSQPMTIDPRMQSYLIRHYQAAGAGGQSGFVPYVILGSQAHPGTAKPAEPASQNR